MCLKELYLLVLLALSVQACEKSTIHTRSSLPKTHTKVHILTKEALKSGIKRSISDDCENKNRDTITHQIASNTILQHRKINATEKGAEINTKRSQTGALALSHIVRNQNAVKRGTLKTPNLKTLQNTPLWSLSKLLDDVSTLSEHKHKNVTAETSNIKGTDSRHSISSLGSSQYEKTGTTKTNVDNVVSKGLRATLTKAIEKVEKVVASKHGIVGKSRDTFSDAERLLAVIRKVNKTIEGVKKSVQNKTEKVSEKHDKSLSLLVNSTKTSPIVSKPPVDPYAEIAAGPDRPKLPELKVGDDPPSSSAGSSMKFGVSDMNRNPASKGSQNPLSGQHDIGGLLDSLTDKLNAAGGGPASDQPLSGNEVKYVQQQLGMEEEAEKQNEGLPSTDIAQGAKEMVDQSTLPEAEQSASSSHPMPAGLNTMKNEPVTQLEKLVGDQGTARMEGPQTDDESLDKEVMDKLAATEEGLSKSISDKTNSLNKLGAMDVFKNSKDGNQEMTDFADADISPGPDPYSLPQDSSRRTDSTPIGTSFSSQEMETSDMLNGEAGLGSMNRQDGIERSDEDIRETAGGIEQAEDNASMGSFEPNANEIPGDTRSQTRTDSYLGSALGGLAEDGGFNTRQHIPDTNYDADSFNNNYNTQMFKRNVILRPKKDVYVSPFSGKESFVTDA